MSFLGGSGMGYGGYGGGMMGGGGYMGGSGYMGSMNPMYGGMGNSMGMQGQ